MRVEVEVRIAVICKEAAKFVNLNIDTTGKGFDADVFYSGYIL